MSDNICPACCSANISQYEKSETITDFFGVERGIRLIEYSCADCGSTGDFFNENDDFIQAALNEIKKNEIVQMLEEFSANKVNFASAERALGLPQRTFAKWKSSDVTPNAAAVSLLKMVYRFPWLVEVADNKYNYLISQKIMIQNAVSSLIHLLSISNIYDSNAITVSDESSEGSLFFNATSGQQLSSGTTNITPSILMKSASPIGAQYANR